MNLPEPFVDIHCHLLPGIDDGAASWEDSLAMARLAAADGIATVVATPHQLGNYRQNHGDAIRARAVKFQQMLDDRGVPLRVLPGADVRIEPDLALAVADGSVLTLADRHKHVLLELPHELYFPLEPVLQQLRRTQLVGILSHPERNAGLLAEPGLVAPLVRHGCLMQITGASLVGTFGPAPRAMSERLVADGLVHFVATDAHSPRTRRPLLRRAFDRVAQIAGQEAAMELCCRNPSRVVRGLDVSLNPPGRRNGFGAKRTGAHGWFRRLRAG